MVELIFRHKQILMLLRDSVDGLTNKEIIEQARKLRPNEIPNDIRQMSQNAKILHDRGFIAITEAVGGKINRITERGLELLSASAPNTVDNKKAPEASTISESMNETADSSPVEEYDAIDLLDSFDNATRVIRDCIQNVLITSEDRVKITDKARKVATLEQLENFPAFTQDVADILAAIRADIEQLEAE